jgi:hypothetical protein
MLTRTDRYDVDVDPNSSRGVDPSSSEGVDTMSSAGVDTMLTQTPGKLLSVLVPDMSYRYIVRLPYSRISVKLNTAAIADIAAIVAIAALAAIASFAAITGLKAVECDISSREGI